MVDGLTGRRLRSVSLCSRSRGANRNMPRAYGEALATEASIDLPGGMFEEDHQPWKDCTRKVRHGLQFAMVFTCQVF